MNNNDRIRKLFEQLLKEKGLKMKFISEKLGLENTTLSKWRNGHLNYGQEKLNQIEEFINKNN